MHQRLHRHAPPPRCRQRDDDRTARLGKRNRNGHIVQAINALSLRNTLRLTCLIGELGQLLHHLRTLELPFRVTVPHTGRDGRRFREIVEPHEEPLVVTHGHDKVVKACIGEAESRAYDRLSGEVAGGESTGFEDELDGVPATGISREDEETARGGDDSET